MQHTGADRSAPSSLPGPNLTYSQTKTGGNSHQAKNKETDNTDNGNVYLPADPRLAEAPDYGTTVHPTGAERSDTGTQPRPNLPYTQTRTGGDNHQAKNKDTGNRDADTRDVGKKLQGLAGDMMADLKNIRGNRAGILDKEGRGTEVTGQGEDEAESEDGKDHKTGNEDNGDKDGNTKDTGEKFGS